MGLTLLGAAGLISFASTLAVALLAVTAVLTLSGMSRLAGCIAGGASLCAALLWLACGGAGTLLEVGFGKKTPEDIPQILEAKSRPAAGFTAPAKGLCMVKVDYH